MKDIKYSDFGKKMTGESGILRLMDDLGNALGSGEKPVAMFGGGNPAIIPEVSQIFKKSLEDMMADDSRLLGMMGVYDTPQGNAAFIEAMAEYLSKTFNSQISSDNIAITPGSQTGFFMLFNLLAGTASGRKRKVLFPLVPEYIGYSDQLIEHEMISSAQPLITKTAAHEFKYAINFDQLDIDEDTALICVSRPTNPSGNVISDEEIKKLQKLARTHNIPLIIDNAYGVPFPGVMDDTELIELDDNTILSFSLSKVGLPGARTGIFVGPERLMKALTNMNAIIALANPNFGQYLATPLVQSGQIDEISRSYIQPYYQERRRKARQLIDMHFDGDLPWRLHEYQGSYFFWLWLEDSKLSGHELYERLKKRGVIAVPGEYFFAGQNLEAWPHARECLRLNFARPDEELEAGIPLLAEEVSRAYGG